MYQQFLGLIGDLPDVWRDKYGSFPSHPGAENTPTHSKINPAYDSIKWKLQPTERGPGKDSADDYYILEGENAGLVTPRRQSKSTPISVLVRAEEHRDRWMAEKLNSAKKGSSSSAVLSTPVAPEKSIRFSGLDTELDSTARRPPKSSAVSADNSKSVVPENAQQARATPTDQLISAILDGDVQGIRAVVRGQGGGSLDSPYWRQVSRSILPFHRSISGLHFHGSETRLVNTIEALASLGADLEETDHAGNSIVHKAIQVCTSKSVIAVVEKLIDKGCNVNSKNMEGDTPLHSECKR